MRSNTNFSTTGKRMNALYVTCLTFRPLSFDLVNWWAAKVHGRSSTQHSRVLEHSPHFACFLILKLNTHKCNKRFFRSWLLPRQSRKIRLHFSFRFEYILSLKDSVKWFRQGGNVSHKILEFTVNPSRGIARFQALTRTVNRHPQTAFSLSPF